MVQHSETRGYSYGNYGYSGCMYSTVPHTSTISTGKIKKKGHKRKARKGKKRNPGTPWDMILIAFFFFFLEGRRQEPLNGVLHYNHLPQNNDAAV